MVRKIALVLSFICAVYVVSSVVAFSVVRITDNFGKEISYDTATEEQKVTSYKNKGGDSNICPRAHSGYCTRCKTYFGEGYYTCRDSVTASLVNYSHGVIEISRRLFFVSTYTSGLFILYVPIWLVLAAPVLGLLYFARNLKGILNDKNK